MKGECTWRRVKSVYKNTTCVDDKLDKAVEKHGKTCFDTLPKKSDPSYDALYLQVRTMLLLRARARRPPARSLAWRPRPSTSAACATCFGFRADVSPAVLFFFGRR